MSEVQRRWRTLLTQDSASLRWKTPHDRRHAHRFRCLARLANPAGIGACTRRRHGLCYERQLSSNRHGRGSKAVSQRRRTCRACSVRLGSLEGASGHGLVRCAGAFRVRSTGSALCAEQSWSGSCAWTVAATLARRFCALATRCSHDAHRSFGQCDGDGACEYACPCGIAATRRLALGTCHPGRSWQFRDQAVTACGL